MRPGIYSNLSEADYRAAPGLSQSLLKALGQEGGPARVKYGGWRATADQKLGRLVHTAILQPHLLDQTYAVTRLMRVGTKEWTEAESAALGREMVKQADYDRAMAIRDAVFRWSSVAREMLLPQDLAAEQSFFWHDPTSGLLCKGRADVANNDYRVLLDLKSTADARRRPFYFSAEKYGYDIQAAHYLAGWRAAGGFVPNEFIILAVEKEPPYLTAAYTFDTVKLRQAGERLDALIELWRSCEQSGHWPGYDDGLQTLSLEDA